ncbi:MAG TPA: DUF2909 domain-containing protein [Rheinheimera sp.]|nr:DUF2909 domain-containing protein [Rheinheimera sp.]
MLIKLIVIALLLFIIVNLIRAGLVMLKPQAEVKMSRFLGRRVMFSAIVLLLIFVAQVLGLIEPNPRPY